MQTRPIELTEKQTRRFLSKIEMRGPDECWPWKASTDDSGYGLVWLTDALFKASRVAWRHFKGTDPSDKLVCHTCDNPPCCNPAHLFLGTKLDNNADRHRKGRTVLPFKLTPTNRRDIDILRKLGIPRVVIAKRYGVCADTISRVSAVIMATLFLAGCTFGADQNPLPATDYPDATTPTDLDEYNGGLIADVKVSGHDCNVVAPDVAAAIQKWQGSRAGFYLVRYHGHNLWAIDKAIVGKFDKS
jgi:hypothetical protein